MSEENSLAAAGSRPEPGQGRVLAIMLAALIPFSVIPLMVFQGGGPTAPFLFNALLRFGCAAFSLCFLAFFYRRFICSSLVWRQVWRGLGGWMFWSTVLVTFDYGLIAWASRYVDTAVAAMLFESWPILVIVLMAWLFRGEGRYQPHWGRLLGAMPLVFGGLFLVVASESGGLAWAADSRLDLFKGVLLSLLAAGSCAFVASSMSWGRDLSRRLRWRSRGGGAGRRRLLNPELFGAVMVFGLSSLVGGILSLGISGLRGESPPAGDAGFVFFLFGLGGGFAIHGFSGNLLRLVNAATNNVSINVLNYFIPVLSLGWLAAFGFVGVARPEWLALGALLIVAGNGLTSLDWGFLGCWSGGILRRRRRRSGLLAGRPPPPGK